MEPPIEVEVAHVHQAQARTDRIRNGGPADGLLESHAGIDDQRRTGSRLTDSDKKKREDENLHPTTAHDAVARRTMAYTLSFHS